MIQKVYELLGITENKKAQDTLSRMINYRIQNLETLFLSNLESLCEQLKVNVLDKADQITFREKVNLIVEAHLEGDEKKLSLFEQYYHSLDVSKVETVSKHNYKFSEPLKDTSKVETVKKSDYRFENEGIYGGIR